jgi:hypothetical protein
MICERANYPSRKNWRNDFSATISSRINARDPDIMWPFVKNRSGGRWAQRFQRVYADDFRLRPGGAFTSKPACSRALGQTRL